jgi:hypothetical protein
MMNFELRDTSCYLLRNAAINCYPVTKRSSPPWLPNAMSPRSLTARSATRSRNFGVCFTLVHYNPLPGTRAKR